jgi:hypothetical protein
LRQLDLGDDTAAADLGADKVTRVARSTMLSHMSDTTIIAERDGKGRFLTGGKPGPGRKKGSRNRHTENFLAAFADDFEKHGASVIEQVRVEKPDVYLRIACDLLPRNLEIEASVDILHDVSSTLEAFHKLTDMLGAEPKLGVRQMRKLVIDHDPSR